MAYMKLSVNGRLCADMWSSYTIVNQFTYVMIGDQDKLIRDYLQRFHNVDIKFSAVYSLYTYTVVMFTARCYAAWPLLSKSLRQSHSRIVVKIILPL